MRLIFILTAGLLMACSAADTPKADDVSVDAEKTMSLAGSEWNLGDGSEAFVAFKFDGKVIGSGSCNNFFGTYTQDGDAVTIGPLGSTRKMCPPEVMKIETKLLNILDQARFVDASHLKMTLKDENRNILFEFKRSDWD